MNAWYQQVNQYIKIHYLFYVLHLEIKNTDIFTQKLHFIKLKPRFSFGEFALVRPNRRDYSI